MGGVDTYSPTSYDGSQNNTYVHINSATDQNLNSKTEGIAIQLAQPLVAGKTYELSMYVYAYNDGIVNLQHPGSIRPGFKLNSPPGATASDPPSPMDQDLSGYPGTSNIPVHTWHLVSFTFVAGGNYQFFMLENVLDNSEEYVINMFVDDVELREVSPNLSVTKTADQPSYLPGQPITYTIDVCNVGPNAAVNPITVTDYVPAGILYSGPTNFTVAPLVVGQCSTITIQGTVDPNIQPQNSIMNNCAYVTAGAALCQNSTQTSNCTVVVVPFSDIAVTKTVDQTHVTTGSTVTYTVSVVNQGIFVCPNVVVSEALPPGLSLVNYTVTGNGTYNGSQLTIPGMFVNQVVTLVVTALVTAVNNDASCLPIYNCAMVISSGNPDGDLSNNSACAPIYLEGAAPIVSTNAATLCNTTIKVYSITNPGNDPNTYFNWTVSCGTIISGQGSPIVQVDFSACTGDILISCSLSNSQTNCSSSVTYLEPGCCFPTTPALNDILVDGNTINDIADLYAAYPTAFTSGAPSYVYNNPGGTLYINGTFTINGTVASVTFVQGSEIRMATNSKIDVLVPGTFSLNLNSTHVASGCGGMWDGIYLNSPNQRINAIGNATQVTLIEDAHNAIVSSNNARYTCNNAVFNKNYIGIRVNGTGANHPGTIRNTVFTCRDLSATTLVMSSFKGNTTITNCQKGELPVGNMPDVDLLGQPVGTRSYAGIYIDKVGTSNINQSSLAITSWTRITVGFANSFTDLNVFDNMDYGVYAVNSNVEVRNNHFQNLTGPTTIVKGQGNHFGIGVYGVNDAQDVTKKIVVGYGNNGTNSFYDCSRGVDLNGYYEASVNGNCFESNQIYNPGNLAPSTVGNYAIFVKSGRFINTDIGKNRIANCSVGIAFFSEFLPSRGGTYFRLVGNVHIYENGIAPVFSGPITTQFVTTAIIAQSVSIQCPLCFQQFAGNLLIEHNGDDPSTDNIIYNVFNGIEVIGWSNLPRIKDNDVTLRYRANFGPSVFQQFGIRAISNGEPMIYRNNIFGNLATGPCTTKTALRAIFCTQNFRPYVRCNTMHDVGQCMVFDGDNTGSVWDNEMFAASDGLVLINNGVIGPQGGPSGTVASDNKWWGPFLNSETLVDNSSSASNSVLPVIPGYPTEPVIHVGAVGNAYFNGVTIVPASSNSNRNCSNPQIATSGGGHDLRVQLRKTVQDSIPMGGYIQEAKWMSKQHVLDLLQSDSSLMSGEPVLLQFYATVTSIGIGQVVSIDQHLLATNTSGANSVNQTMVPIVVPEQNYQDVNSIYISLFSGNVIDSIQIQTLENIAVQCPAQGGIAVYRARTLLSIIDDDVRNWQDTCNTPSSARLGGASDSTSVNRNVTLYPNPNNGEMILSYALPDEQPGQFYLYDLYGNLVYSEYLEPGVQTKTITIYELSSGMYFYQILAGEQTVKSDKVIIQK